MIFLFEIEEDKAVTVLPQMILIKYNFTYFCISFLIEDLNIDIRPKFMYM